MSNDRWIYKENGVCVCVCVCVCTHIYSVIKKKILPFVTTWMELEGFMLSKIIEIDKYSMISLRYGIF